VERPTFDDVLAAAMRIRPYVHRTPVLTSETLDRLAGARLFFKCENLQKAGAFKARGATNAVFALPDEAARNGVATHSSGNHAAALAMAAGKRGVRAFVVMPENAPEVKKRAVGSYGAQIIYCEPTLPAREAGLREVVDRTGAAVVHPYDDPWVIAGQGTAALELLAEVPDLDALIAPVGGGGLMSGSCITARGTHPEIRLFGAEPALADDARRSLAAGEIIPSTYPPTVADGLRTSLGELTFPILRAHLEEILTADEAAIVAAMREMWEKMKLIVEPSGAVPLATVLANPRVVRGLRVGMIVSGGNVDLDHLPWVG
jgi:threonine dehydratase